MTGSPPRARPPLPRPQRLRPADVLRLGLVGVHTRPLRTVLASVGVAIGIAALVAVIGVPASNQSALRARFEALGPNLLQAEAGSAGFGGDRPAKLPDDAADRAARIAPVQAASATGNTDAAIRRNDRLPPERTGGLAVRATRLDLLAVLRGSVREGVFLNEATERFPTTVLGAGAAARLGIALTDETPNPVVRVDDHWFTVVGVLAPLPLHPLLDTSALVGWTAARTYLGFDGHPSTVYVRSDDDAVGQVRQVLGRSINPESPGEVLVTKPSDALAAQQLTEQAYSALYLGLAGVALLVGGVGVANTMIVSVMERRREIGLRRALGATRRQIRGQFLAESVVLAGLGGGLGVLLGSGITTWYATSQGWPAVLPWYAVVGGPLSALVLGSLAGAYPAIRASRLTPTEALTAG
ncbi:ABC transporter permease [Saccharothrix sp. NRRL B-16348]|uniref:ABC transporter permease n=1 Tax=Saccharothrix sp. NRRL B-16348 TaxID=1415542 RepID=UPI0006AFB72B|nr:ABC transporter permease [Saccharothrix sp. NRRL B-16348]KOX12712.1 ABC transporter permease [Saccharothrix sp. NRRL B-16348]